MDAENHNSIDYAFNGKIMIGSVAILFVVCFGIVLYHVYIRWFRRLPVRHQDRRRQQPYTPATTIVSPQGLDLCVVNSLPTFIYNSKNHESPLECAVCLSEFEENETGRVLPECNHRFHVDCIDMWLQSHCDCPLCRAQVKVQPGKNPVEPIEDPHEIIIYISELDDTDSGSSSGLHQTTQKQ
ncbi:hypothetical protein BUALT_Bualt02G0236900 [Buddleja alternifolia]|uniref:RING-type E3 ubiquitin transferase n=1 Tax=Buddleja alternifolia TaxID=168488 RepID=A0AAV6Y6Z7_9LAMI|nr:hypothetical protein BUALT_Bualt02G0236900 [Buddleja alternifolia]